MNISIDTSDWNQNFVRFCRRHLAISDFAVQDFHDYLNAQIPNLPRGFNFRHGFLGHVYSDPAVTELQATTIEFGFDNAVDQYHRWFSTPLGLAAMRKGKIQRLLKTL
ncbi:hypothetical protein [Rufibacter latericius]|uniref:Uncharacterized protein n=1 Tax=Rufibacter latericius TaxID=2487040 RepID=A0A3M9MCV8_9BACT|nr:hypothetical protein [Rufibacter latericius]RNI22663.1 hypothetical protein EFB08_21455 [Rufibacter latericius]